MAENNLHVPALNYPKIPESADKDMRNYLLALEELLRDALKGSLYINQTFENGEFGN